MKSHEDPTSGPGEERLFELPDRTAGTIGPRNKDHHSEGICDLLDGLVRSIRRAELANAAA